MFTMCAPWVGAYCAWTGILPVLRFGTTGKDFLRIAMLSSISSRSRRCSWATLYQSLAFWRIIDFSGKSSGRSGYSFFRVKLVIEVLT